MKRVRHTDLRDGYDRWSHTYDDTPNPLVALDRRYTISQLAPRPGERVLDAACGTGRNLHAMCAAGARPMGLDLSLGMLRVARQSAPRVPLIQADLEATLPLRRDTFDAILCALVGEHLRELRTFFRASRDLLRPGGRFLFSVFHPELAAAGIEANFEQSGIEYRLGAERHTIDDYLCWMQDAGFEVHRQSSFAGDAALAREIPGAEKYDGRPLLLIVEGRRAA